MAGPLPDRVAAQQLVTVPDLGIQVDSRGTNMFVSHTPLTSLLGLGVCYGETLVQCQCFTEEDVQVTFLVCAQPWGARQWSLGVCWRRWQPQSFLAAWGFFLQIQEGANESNPDPPGLRGRVVSTVSPTGEWQWWHLVKAAKEEPLQKIFLTG